MSFQYYWAKILKKIHVPALKKCKIHKTSAVASGSNLLKVNVGKFSYIGNNCTIQNASIGSFCSIADNCLIGAANHPTSWISSSPVFYSGRNILKKHFSNNIFPEPKFTVIGNDVWIGSNCLLKAGISIGNGAILGMGSVATKNIGSFEIWVGNPAHFLKKRFPDDIITKIEQEEWWNWTERKLKAMAPTFNNPEDFFKANASSEPTELNRKGKK